MHVKHQLIAFLIYEKAMSEADISSQAFVPTWKKSVVNGALYFYCDIKGDPANWQVSNEKWQLMCPHLTMSLLWFANNLPCFFDAD